MVCVMVDVEVLLDDEEAVDVPVPVADDVLVPVEEEVAVSEAVLVPVDVLVLVPSAAEPQT